MTNGNTAPGGFGNQYRLIIRFRRSKFSRPAPSRRSRSARGPAAACTRSRPPSAPPPAGCGLVWSLDAQVQLRAAGLRARLLGAAHGEAHLLQQRLAGGLQVGLAAVEPSASPARRSPVPPASGAPPAAAISCGRGPGSAPRCLPPISRLARLRRFHSNPPSLKCHIPS